MVCGTRDFFCFFPLGGNPTRCLHKGQQQTSHDVISQDGGKNLIRFKIMCKIEGFS